jgi:pilus assembly protein CpaB
MGRRTLLLIASLLVAALGTALIWLYVQSADSRAQAGEAQVEVLVAKEPVLAGTPAEQIRLGERRFPRSFVASYGPGLVTDPKEIQGYAVTPIVAGVPLMAGQFGKVLSPPTPPVQLDPAKLALQVSLPDPQRLAGLLQPGSMIRIYVATEDKAKGDTRADVLLDHVKVLASGPVTESNGTTAKAQVPQAIVTLELRDDQARQLVRTQSQGSGTNSLWFGLLGTRTPAVPDSLGTAG